MASETAKLIPIQSEKKKDIQHILDTAQAESGEFRGIFIAALTEDELGNQTVRLYYSGLNRLERGGILAEAADIIRNPQE